MAEQHEHQSRGLFHHKKESDGEAKPSDPQAEAKKHAHHQHLAQAGAILSGGVALYEKHKAKKDPENAEKHHIAQTVAGAIAIGAGAAAVHERHNKKQAEKEAKNHH